MLRCAGCGALVSEWAARCPVCHHATQDAAYVAEVVEPPSEPVIAASEPPTPNAVNATDFPRRPPARSRRWLIGTATGLAAATGLTIGLTVPSGHGTTGGPIPPAVRALAGRIVAETTDGTLLLSDVDGSHRSVMRTRSFVAGDRPVLVDAHQAVVAVSGERLGDTFADTDPTVAANLPPAATIAPVDALADHGQAVVVLTNRSGASTVSVAVEPIGAGSSVNLGIGNDAVGDPQALGAFVTVAAPRRANDVLPGGVDALPDTRVELRDAGLSPLLLATTAELDQAVHQDPSQRVNLGVFPDHDGQKVAVELNLVGGPESNSALVILDRHGRVLDTVDAAFGPMEYTPVYWSPDEASLAYATIGSVGTALAVYSGTRTSIQSLESGTSVNGCAWAPDSSWVLCLADSTYTQNWLLARSDADLAPIYSLPARGSPLAWLP